MRPGESGWRGGEGGAGGGAGRGGGGAVNKLLHYGEGKTD